MQNYSYITIFFLFLVAYYFFLRYRKNRGILTRSISITELEGVYRDISRQAVETSFAVFVIPRPNQASIEIQLSVEKGLTGLDFILEHEANKDERTRIEEYFLSQEIEYKEKEMNNWHYLRIEEGDIVRICSSLISNLYGPEEIILKYEGFTLRQFPITKRPPKKPWLV